MVEFDNPVARSVFLRFVGPLVPVWLVGATLVILLDRFSLGGPSLSDRDLGLLLVVYSLLVAGLVSALYYHEYRRSPDRIVLGVDAIAGAFGGRGRPGLEITYGSILRILPSRYFPARVEARSPVGPIAWMNLTDDNALRLTEAWGAWRERAEGSAGRA